MHRVEVVPWSIAATNCAIVLPLWCRRKCERFTVRDDDSPSGRYRGRLLGCLLHRLVRQESTNQLVVEEHPDRSADQRPHDGHPAIKAHVLNSPGAAVTGEIRRQPTPEVAGRVAGVTPLGARK